jgi:hypothetical protein
MSLASWRGSPATKLPLSRFWRLAPSVFGPGTRNPKRLTQTELPAPFEFKTGIHFPLSTSTLKELKYYHGALL